MGATLAVAVLLGPGRGIGLALEVPPAGGFYIQTSGPNTAHTIGDWYSSTVAGGGSGYHYVEITVPCGWPAATPLHLDLFSPEMNAVAASAGVGDETRGALDSTQFELYGPGASVGPGYASPGPGTGIAGSQVTYPPGAPAVPEAWVRYWTLNPVACGVYILRSAILLPEADDDNGWRLRVGLDNDADPTNAPPANLDDPDGVPGTNDELVVGQVQITYQHSIGGVGCLTLYEYISPGLPSVTFHNYDMDGNTRVRYYAPSDTYDPTAMSGGTVGTLSVNGQWNQGTIARGGDTLLNPEAGWWRVVTCLGSTNQFIQEAQDGVGAYFVQPPIPALGVVKSDGLAEATPGDTLTYTVALANTASGPTAGAAHAIVMSDQLPVGTTFVSCQVQAPATGTCSRSGGVVTATLDGWLNAGTAAQVAITVTVDPDATGSLTDVVSVTYADGLGNAFAPVSATDVDTVLPGALPNTSLDNPLHALALAAVVGLAVTVALDLNVRSNRRRAGRMPPA